MHSTYKKKMSFFFFFNVLNGILSIHHVGLGMIVHACNPSYREAEAKGESSKPAGLSW
jgi:hypothetical protein